MRESTTLALILPLLLLGACDVPPDSIPDRNEVATIQQGLHCDEWFPSGGCLHWAPDAPPGFTDCAGDNHAYQNEVVICSGNNFTGYCFYKNIASGTTFGSPYLNDMDRPYPNEYHVRSYKTNLTRWGALYDYSSYGGSWYSTAPVEEKPYFYTLDASSLIMSN
jgi:hypothetical protein